MNPEAASDEIVATIAGVDRHRQEMEKESDPAKACNEALRKLHELLDHERKALQLHGPGTRHASNVGAVEAAIARLQKLAGTANPGAIPKNPLPGRHQVSPQDASPTIPRSKARRRTGRSEH